MGLTVNGVRIQKLYAGARNLYTVHMPKGVKVSRLTSKSSTSMPRNDSRPAIVFFPLTVDQDFSATAQKLLRRECGADIHTITLESLPDTHEMRLWVTLTAAAYSVALHALILGLPAAEFGIVKVARTESAILDLTPTLALAA